MSDKPAETNLHCTACGHTQYYDLARMLRSLQSRGKLKRAKDPVEAMVTELFYGSLAEVRCRQCDQAAYEATEVDSWDEDTLSVKACERCRAPIDPDRLEIFPDTKLCLKCQQAEETNPGGDEEPDFCPRCGGLMKLRRASQGVAKYLLTCGDCGYKS